ncbi:hypothetical protein CGQ19_25785, partial [Klebsiella quasipneumoniae]
PWKNWRPAKSMLAGNRLAQAGRLLKPIAPAPGVLPPGGAPIWWCLNSLEKLAAREVYVGGEPAGPGRPPAEADRPGAGR